jgi:hypothetical protein
MINLCLLASGDIQVSVQMLHFRNVLLLTFRLFLLWQSLLVVVVVVVVVRRVGGFSRKV